MRYCRECAQPLADGRADKQFCSSTCRVKAHRSTRLAAAAQLKEWLARRPHPDTGPGPAACGRSPPPRIAAC